MASTTGSSLLDGEIALVNPPLAIAGGYHLSHPLGLLVVAAALRERDGAAAPIVDLSLELAEGALPVGEDLCAASAERLAALAKDVYAFTVQCVDLPVALAIARRLRRLRPAARIVFGGHHASLLGELLVERFDFVDGAVVGSGEEALLRPEQAGRWLAPAYDAAPEWGRYARVSLQPTGLVEVARGCPFECSFCSIPLAYGRRVRHKPVADVVAEIEFLARQGCDEVHLVDDTLTVNKRYVRELAAALGAARLGVEWTAMTRVDLVGPELLAELAAAGCRSILYGLESTDAAALAGIDKHARRYPPLTSFVRWHLAAGIAPKLYFLANLPCDSRTGLERSLWAAAQISALDPGSCHVQLPRIVPGTKLAAEVAGPLALDRESPYPDALRQTVGDADEVWELVAANPDLCSTYYSAPGPVDRDTALALAWTGDRLLESIPLTLAALGERGAILDLFQGLGSERPGAGWRDVPLEVLLDTVAYHLADGEPELVDPLRFERWLRGDGDGAAASEFFVSRVDLQAAERALFEGAAVRPALATRSRVYRLPHPREHERR